MPLTRAMCLGTAKKVVVVGGGDTSIDVASIARRLGQHHRSTNDDSDHTGFTAHDVAGSLVREGIQATLTSLFPLEKMTAAEHEREDALREGVDIKGVRYAAGNRASDAERFAQQALKMCECTMDGNAPRFLIEGTEFEIECDIVISAIGQFGDFTGHGRSG